VIIIAESHLSIHTWPEYKYAAVDIFTCGTTLEPLKAAGFIINSLNSKNPSIVEIKRGILTIENKKIKHKLEEKIEDASKKIKNFQNVY